MRVAVRLHRHSRAPNAEAPGVVAAAHVQPRRARGRRGLGGAFGKHLPYVLGGSLGQVADWNAAEKECAEFQDRLDAFLRQST